MSLGFSARLLPSVSFPALGLSGDLVTTYLGVVPSPVLCTRAFGNTGLKDLKDSASKNADICLGSSLIQLNSVTTNNTKALGESTSYRKSNSNKYSKDNNTFKIIQVYMCNIENFKNKEKENKLSQPCVPRDSHFMHFVEYPPCMSSILSQYISFLFTYRIGIMLHMVFTQQGIISIFLD